MRLFICSLALFSLTTLSAQTSVIGLKSHHGNMAELQHSPDQFGVVPPQKKIDTIARIDSNCVIQIGTKTDWGRSNSRQFHDTVCEHWYYQQVNYDIEKIQEHHGKSVVLIGFEDTFEIEKTNEADEATESRKRKKPKKQKRPRWLFFPLILIAFGTKIPQSKKS